MSFLTSSLVVSIPLCLVCSVFEQDRSSWCYVSSAYLNDPEGTKKKISDGYASSSQGENFILYLRFQRHFTLSSIDNKISICIDPALSIR